MDARQASAFLSGETHKMVAEMAKRTKDLMAKLIMHGLELSKLTFIMDKNL
jgi:dipeptidase